MQGAIRIEPARTAFRIRMATILTTSEVGMKNDGYAILADSLLAKSHFV